MRTPKTLKALLLSALFATAALGASASAAQVYLEYDDAPSGLVDIYVDGKLMFVNVSPGTFSMFPTEVPGGQHEVVVTPSDLGPGQQDLLRSTVNVARDGTYTLTFGQYQDNNGLYELKLGLTPGMGSREDQE